MSDISSPYELLLSCDIWDFYSYTCDALGGPNASIRDMLFDSASASEFIERYNKSPWKEIYERPDEPSGINIPYDYLIYACARIEQEEQTALNCMLNLKHTPEEAYKLHLDLRKKSIEKMKKVINSR